MKQFFEAIGKFLFGCVAVWLNAYAVTMLWSWFVMATFGLPVLTIPVVVGLHILHRLFVTNTRVEVMLAEDGLKADVEKVILSLIALAAGWVIHSYCM